MIESKYKVEPLPGLQLSGDYRSQPLFFKPVAEFGTAAHALRTPERRRGSLSRSIEPSALDAVAPPGVARQSKSRSTPRSSRTSSRRRSDAAPVCRSTRASVLRQKKTIENEIEALLQSELEERRERESFTDFTRPIPVTSEECPPPRPTRSATLRHEHARRTSEKMSTASASRSHTPRVRSASARTQDDASQAAVVRATRAAELRRSLNVQRLHELEQARAKLEQEEALIEQGRGSVLRERARAVRTRPSEAVATDAPPVVKATKAAALLRQRVEEKLKALERLEALEAAAQEALLHPTGRGHALSPRSTKSSLLRGRTATAQMQATKADDAGATTPRRRGRRESGDARSRRASASAKRQESQVKPSAAQKAPSDRDVNPLSSRASLSGCVVQRPSEPALSSISDMEDPAVLLPSAILQIEHVVSDSDVKDRPAELASAGTAGSDAETEEDGAATVAAVDMNGIIVASLVEDERPHEEAGAPMAQTSSTTSSASHHAQSSASDTSQGSCTQGGVESGSSSGVGKDAMPIAESEDSISVRLATPDAADRLPAAATAFSSASLETIRDCKSDATSSSDSRNSECGDNVASTSPVQHASGAQEQQDENSLAHQKEGKSDSQERSVLSAHDSFRIEDRDGAVEETVDSDEGAADPLFRAYTAPRVTTSIDPLATQLPLEAATAVAAAEAEKQNAGKSPSPKEPALVNAMLGVVVHAAPAVPLSKEQEQRTRTISRDQEHQAEALGKLRKARATNGQADHPLQPFSSTNVGDGENSNNSSVESIPTFAAVTGVETPSVALSSAGTGSPSRQWSRYPTPPQPHATNERSRASLSLMDFSRASFSSVATGTPSPVSIRQFRLNTARILYRRFFTKWRAYRRGVAPAVPPPITAATATVARPERSQTAPPLAEPADRPVVSARLPPSLSQRPSHRSAALQVPPTNQTPLARREPDASPVKRPERPRTPPRVRSQQAPVAWTEPPVPAPQRSRVVPALTVPRFAAGEVYPSTPGSAQCSPSKGLRVPRLQESFASLPRGVSVDATHTTMATLPQHANDSWRALEPSLLMSPYTQAQHSSQRQGALSSSSQGTPQTYRLPSPIRRIERAGASPPSKPQTDVWSPAAIAAASLLADWSTAPDLAPESTPTSQRNTSALAAIRMPGVAPDAWSVLPPEGGDTSLPPLSPPRSASRLSPGEGACCLISPDGSAREMAERTPCDITLDALLFGNDENDDGSEVGPLDLATGGDQEPSRHAPTPLLSNLVAAASPQQSSAQEPQRPADQSAHEDDTAQYAVPADDAVNEAVQLFPQNDGEPRASLVQATPVFREEEEEEEEEEERSGEQHDAVTGYQRNLSGGFSSSGSRLASEPAVPGKMEVVIEATPRTAGVDVGLVSPCPSDNVGEVSPHAVAAHDRSSSSHSSGGRVSSRGAREKSREDAMSEPFNGDESCANHHQGQQGVPALSRNTSPEMELYRPQSPIPSTMGSVGRAETYYMSASNPTPSDGRWGAGTPDGSPNPANMVDLELQRDLDDPYSPNADDLLRYIKYVHRDL